MVRKSWSSLPPVDGVLLFDKPQGLSSNAALQRVRRLLAAPKAGHGGTLDPMATGLLPLLFGEATKFSHTLLDADKSYEALVRFGVRTSTGDAEGEVIRESPAAVSAPALERALARFAGDIDQMPPMHSALKRDGTPLYRLARQGIEVERAPRRVRIHRIEVLERDDACARIAVDCSKGTYIRALADDLGEALGCGGHLAALRRTRIGEFSLDEAHDMETLETAGEQARARLLLPVDALLGRYARVDFAPAEALAFLRGQMSGRADFAAGTPCRVFDGTRFLGVGEVTGTQAVKPRRVIANGA